MLGTGLVTQGNKGDSVIVFLACSSLPYGLTVSPSTYGHNTLQLPL